MKFRTLVLAAMIFPAAANAQNHDMHNMHNAPMQHPTDYADPNDHNMPDDYYNVTTDPQVNEPIVKTVPDGQPGPQENFGVQQVHDNENLYRIMGDRLEMRYQDGDNVALYDIQGWYGNDYNKAWIKAEGEYNTSENEHEQTSLEALYSRNIASFWDVQAGLRHDFINNEDDRNFAAFGVQGLAPYWFEVEATSYLSDEGDVSAVLEAEYDLLLSQRFIIQPRFETEVSLNDVPEYNIGSGVTGFETGIRARYEFSRKFAPYIGVSWEQAVGETADLMQADGEDTSKTFLVGGIKFWF